MEATPPTLIASLVTPGWSTVVFSSEPPPPPPPDFDPDDALPHAVATSSSVQAATTNRVPRTRMQHPPVYRRLRRLTDSNVRFRAQPGTAPGPLAAGTGGPSAGPGRARCHATGMRAPRDTPSMSTLVFFH